MTEWVYVACRPTTGIGVTCGQTIYNRTWKKSAYTVDLFRQYRKHLGFVRFFLLKQSQILVVPTRVRRLLRLGAFSLLSVILPFYKLSRMLKLDWFLKSLILPTAYKHQIKNLDVTPSS